MPYNEMQTTLYWKTKIEISFAENIHHTLDHI